MNPALNRMTLTQKINPIASSFILLGLTLITTAVWYAAYRSNIVADGWVTDQAALVQDINMHGGY